MKQVYWMLLLLTILFTNSLLAQEYNDSIPAHETFTIQSKEVGELRTINVWTPPGYKINAGALPVLYMPDGGIKEDFPHMANTLAALVNAKKIAPIILVGIENTQRRKDLTGPTIVKKDKKIAPVVGGSQQFRAFISNELFKEINERYKTKGQKGILGESLAGLFVVETFLLQPALFDFYIAFDPSLWWNNEYLIKTANEYLEKFPTTQKTYWFAGSATEGIFETTTKLADVLTAANKKSITWQYSPEPSEKHSTIFRATKEKALIWTLNNLPKQATQ